MMPASQLARLEALLEPASAIIEGRRFGTSLNDLNDRLLRQEAKFAILEAISGCIQEIAPPASEAAAQVLASVSDIADFALALSGVASQDDVKAIADPDSLSADIQKLSSFERLFKQLATAHFDLTASPLRGVGSILDALGDEQTSSAIQLLSGDIDASLRGPTEVLCRKLSNLCQRTQSLSQELETLIPDPEVDAFLKAFLAGAATLDLLTPSTISWLREHNALDKFVVQSRRRG